MANDFNRSVVVVVVVSPGPEWGVEGMSLMAEDLAADLAAAAELSARDRRRKGEF